MPRKKLVRRLISEAKLAADQPLFQGYMGTSIDKPLSGKPCAYNQVRDDLLAEIADLCEMDFACAMKHFGTHSLRSGGATKAAEALVS